MENCKDEVLIARIAQRINALRIHFGMKKSEVAREAKISYSNYRRIEAGLIEPGSTQIMRIADAFEISVSQFYDYTYFPEISLKIAI